MKKIFIVDKQPNHSWNGNQKSIIGVEIEGNNLYLQTIKGIDLTVEGFLTILKEIQDEINEVSTSYIRSNPFKVLYHEGMSGNKTWTMSFLESRGNFWAEKKQEILYLSCFNKIATSKFFIPDLVYIVPTLVEVWEEDFSCQGVTTIREVEQVKTAGYNIPA